MQYYGKEKRKRTIALVVSYIVMTLAVIALSTICILLVLGYRFDVGMQRIERGALLQLNSAPTGATVSLDGKELSSKTQTKQDVEVGQHQIIFSKQGYRSWQKQFSVRAGEVRHLSYARLVPTTIHAETVVSFPTLSDAVSSPDRGWIASLQHAEQPKVDIVDVRDAKNIKRSDIVLPNETLTLPEGSTHSFSLVEWDAGSQYLLVRHAYGDAQHEYIRINRNDPKDIINISTKFGVVFGDVHFSTGGTFYGLENGNLRRFDLGASSLSEPIARSVERMELYGAKDIALVQTMENRRRVAVVVDSQLVTVATYDDTLPVLINLTKYYNERYVAIVRGSSFELIKNPEKKADQGLEKVITLTYAGDVKWLDTSTNGRFVILGNGTQFMTYDIELEQRTDTNLPGGSSDKINPLQWIDGFVLASTADNKLRLSDFDGDNQQIITDALPYMPVVLSQDNKVLFTYSREQSGAVALQTAKIVLD